MLITEMMPLTKSRYKITLEDGSVFVLYRGELRRFCLQMGEEVPEDVYDSIFREILPKRAKLRCMNLLKTKDYTKKQLEEKLIQGEYPAEIIAEAIAYVESYGYINDEKYAKDYISYHMQTRSRKRIENDLARKGIDKDLVYAAFTELEEDGIEMDETAMVQKILMKKNFRVQDTTYEERQKMCAYLYRKGFHTNTISKALLLDITSF
ncbi:MAG: recombination regulator RecX [Lachnospiraceae bacterium]|nr:recombination regulator RecX [Lachnospiraceae bacterium]